MTLRTSLVVSGDTEQAQRAVAELDQSMARAGQTTEELGQEVVKASVGLERLRVAKEQAAAAGITLSQEQERAAIHGRELVIEQARTAQAIQRTTASAGAQRAGMQQLSYQLGDVATMFAMGARPMQIFASQGTQVVQAIGLMRGNAGGLVGFLSGPWGIALSAAAIALTPLISRLLETRDAAAETSEELKKAVDNLFSSLNRTSALSTVLHEAAKDRVNALGEVARLNREIERVERGIDAGAQAGVLNEHSLRQLRSLREQRAAAEARAENADAQARRMIEEVRTARERDERLRALNGDNDNDSSGGRSSRAAGAIRVRTQAISEEERARRQANEETLRFISALEDEIAKIGLDEKALRALEVSRALEKAQTDEQRQAIADLNAERERALTIEEARQRAGAIAEDNKGISGQIAEIEREAQVLGLVGWQRERAMLLLEREAEIRPLLAELAQAEANGQHEIAAGLREQIRLLETKYAMQIQIGNEAERLEGERERVRELSFSYHQLGMAGVGALSDIALRGGDAIDVMQRLAASIAEAALEAALLGSGPLASVFGGSGGGGLIGSVLGPIFGGGRATGGPVSPGKYYAVNERSTAPGLFFPLGPGRIDPPSSGAAPEAASTVVELHVRSGELFTATVEQISGQVAVRTVQEAAPTIVEVSAAETARRMSRPRL